MQIHHDHSTRVQRLQLSSRLKGHNSSKGRQSHYIVNNFYQSIVSLEAAKLCRAFCDNGLLKGFDQLAQLAPALLEKPVDAIQFWHLLLLQCSLGVARSTVSAERGLNTS